MSLRQHFWLLIFLCEVVLIKFLLAASASAVSSQTAETDVLKSLSQIIDPDFGTDIVSCGFVKDLNANKALGEVV